MARKTKRVGMIGVGKLGLPCAEVMAEYYEVEGFDLSPIQPANFTMVDSLAKVCANKDIIFLAVPTPHEPSYGGEVPSMHLPPKDFDYSTVKAILSQINTFTVGNPLVALISTVLPGSTRRELIPLVNNYRFIYNPYLIAMGSVKWDMVNPEMLIIGTKDGSENGDAAQLIDFYQPLLNNNPRIVVGTWDEAECLKIFYNTFISMKISLVNMIQDVAEHIGNINVDIVTEALKHSTRRIMGPNYMTAGMGDGGACHPRDNIALRWLAQDSDLGYDLFEAIMTSREAQSVNLARKLVKLAEQHNLDEVWIHGKAYKPHVDYTNGSYSLLVAHYVTKMGKRVRFVDPLTGDSADSIYGVILLAHAAEVTYGDGSNLQQQFYCAFEPGSVIVDPWRRVNQKDAPGCKIIHYGNTRLHK